MSDDTSPTHLLPRPEVPDAVLQTLRAAVAALRKNPGAIRLRDLRGIAGKVQAWEIAAELVEAELDTRPPEGVATWLLRALIELLLKVGRATEAEAAYDRLRAIDPDALETRDEVRLLEQLADVYDKHLDLPSRATAVLERLVTLLPQDAPLYERLATLAAQAGELETAAHAWERYADLAGGDERARGALHAAGRHRRELGQTAQAARIYRTLLKRDPDDHRAEAALGALEPAGPARADSELPIVVDDETMEHPTAPEDGPPASTASAAPTATPPRRRTDEDALPAEVAGALARAARLVAEDRAAEAATLLRDTLATLADAAPEVRGIVVMRWGLARAAAGDDDEAYELLHEAHRLRPRDLAITLALGEASYARRAWREAALLLGGLARHPDAKDAAPLVARGLARAAEAEMRLKRADKAEELARAATQLDPACAPAWHALGERAMERGDFAEAASCLEREASVTQDPATRLRVFDALGDLALDVLADPARAIGFYERALDAATTDAARLAVLEKQLEVLRAQDHPAARAAACERLAALVPERKVKAALLAEAVDTFLAAGERERARAAAERFVDEDPLDPGAVRRAAELAIADDELELAAALLGRALAAWDKAGVRDAERTALWVLHGEGLRRRGDWKGAEDAYERAIQRGAPPEAAREARKGLTAIAAAVGRPVLDVLAALVEETPDPADLEAYACALAEAADAGQPLISEARALAQLAIACGLDAEAKHDAWLARHPAKRMASDAHYGGVLDELERRALIDEAAGGPLGAALELLWEAAPVLLPSPAQALAAAGFADAQRVTAAAASEAAAIYAQVAKTLAGPTMLLHAAADKSAPDATLVLTAPPVVVLGARLASRRARSTSEVETWDDATLRFTLGRVVELARPARAFAAGMDAETFARLVQNLRAAFAPPPPTGAPTLAPDAAKLKQDVPVRVRVRLGELIAGASDAAFDAAAYQDVCRRAADRAGLLVCGHVGAALAVVGGASAAPHLVALACSRPFLAARRRLNPAA